MKISDRFGNELREGQCIFWAPTGLIAKIKSIDPGGIVTPDGPSQPKIVIEVGLNVQLAHGSAKTFLSDFVVTTDPKQAEHTLGILEKAAKSRSVQ